MVPKEDHHAFRRALAGRLPARCGSSCSSPPLLPPLPGLVRPFVEIGAGAYDLDPGTLRGGFHAGCGAQLNLSPKVALEATAKYHDVATPAPRLQFATAHAGVRIRF